MTDTSACKYWDCGWCYAPDDVKPSTSATPHKQCLNPDCCLNLKSQMTEIEELKAQIKVLEAKLSLLEEIEKHKSPAEEAYKRVYGNYPTGEYSWIVFKKGYKSAQEDYKVGEYQPTPQEPEDNEWKSVALRFGEKLSDVGPDGYYELSPDAWFRWAVFTYDEYKCYGGKMTDMKTKAQEVLYAYMDVEKDLSEPKILIHTLKELINQLQVSPGIIKCPDIIELCEELKKL